MGSRQFAYKKVIHERGWTDNLRQAQHGFALAFMDKLPGTRGAETRLSQHPNLPSVNELCQMPVYRAVVLREGQSSSYTEDAVVSVPV